jgi:predicted nucleic acid-binding protein
VTCFVDTSALLPIIDVSEARHLSAGATWHQLIEREEALVTTNYVVIEACALAQRRIGLEAVRTLQYDVLPAIDVRWIDVVIHRAGIDALLLAGRRQLSLVDCTSFRVMRDLGVRRAFAFDSHFVEQGFTCLPEGVAQ